MPQLRIEAPGGLTVSIDAAALRPMLRSIIAELQEEIAADDRLAYAEKDAAALLGVQRHVLRDARLRGEVKAVKLGKSWRYSRANLLHYLDGAA